jgi:hypothetical protein
MLSHPPTVVSAGDTIDGGMVSVVQVNVCEHVDVLPHASVAVNVRVWVLVQLFVATAPSDDVTVGVPQLSVAVALLAGTEAGLQPRLVSAGHEVNTGATESTVHVNTSVQVTVLPQASVAVYVLFCTREQPLAITEPNELVIVGVPQLSVAVALPGPGTEDGLHPRLAPGGQNVNTGATVSVVQIKC